MNVPHLLSLAATSIASDELAWMNDMIDITVAVAIVVVITCGVIAIVMSWRRYSREPYRHTKPKE
jgi:hypothetical protein